MSRCHARSLDVSRCHARSLDVSRCHARGPDVSRCHARGLDVSRCHARSLDVSRCHARRSGLTYDRVIVRDRDRTVAGRHVAAHDALVVADLRALLAGDAIFVAPDVGSELGNSCLVSALGAQRRDAAAVVGNPRVFVMDGLSVGVHFLGGGFLPPPPLPPCLP